MKKVETGFKSSIPIKGSCHEEFQEVAEIFAKNFDKYDDLFIAFIFINKLFNTFYVEDNPIIYLEL